MIVNSEDRGTGAPETRSAKVSIVIPCRAEYVAVARLAILGVANRLSYSYDEVEDVRLAVGEACTHAVERALAALAGSGADEPAIWIDSTISPDGLNIDVRDNVATAGDTGSSGGAVLDDEELGFDKQDLGALLMEILVDTVEVETLPSGTVVHLFKRAPQEQPEAGLA